MAATPLCTCEPTDCPECEGVGTIYVTPSGHPNDPYGRDEECEHCAGEGVVAISEDDCECDASLAVAA